MLDKILYIVCGFLGGVAFNLVKIVYEIAYQNSLNFMRSQVKNSVKGDLKNEQK